MGTVSLQCFLFLAVWSFFTLRGQVVRCVFPAGVAFGFAVCFWCGVFIFVADLVSLAAVVAFWKFIWCFSFVCELPLFHMWCRFHVCWRGVGVLSVRAWFGWRAVATCIVVCGCLFFGFVLAFVGASVGRSRGAQSCLWVLFVAWARAGLVVGAVFGVASLVSVVRGRWWCPHSLGCLVGVRCVFEVVRARLPRGFDGGGAVVCLGCVCMLCGCRVVVLFGAPGVGFVGLRWFLCVCVGFVVVPVVVWVVVCWVRCRGCGRRHWLLAVGGIGGCGFWFRVRCLSFALWLPRLWVGCRADGLRGRQVVVSAPGAPCFLAVFVFVRPGRFSHCVGCALCFNWFV